MTPTARNVTFVAVLPKSAPGAAGNVPHPIPIPRFFEKSKDTDAPRIAPAMRRIVKPTRPVLLCNAVTLDVTQMSAGRANSTFWAATIELRNPRLDDDAPIGWPEAMPGAAMAKCVVTTPDPISRKDPRSRAASKTLSPRR